MVAQAKEIVNIDARYTTWQSSGAVHAILKYDLKKRKICARWISYLLTYEQKRGRV
jgi:hypothetical protein